MLYSVMENKNSLISIVIPCFNAEKYLAATIDSCLQQTYTNWEVIVVDDGSTDASLEIARNYSNYYSNIKVITIENNGQCFARNLGMEEAQGEYIQFLDSDDLLLPEYLEEQLKALNTNQADLSISGELAFKDSNFSERKEKLNHEKVSLLDCIVYHSFLECIKNVKTSYNSILISREKVLEVGGFEVSSKAANEIVLHLKLATKFPELKAVYYPKKLLLKRVHEKSIGFSIKKQKNNQENQELKQIPHLLHSLQKSAEYYLSSNSQDLLLKEFIFNKLYFKLIYAYRDNHHFSYIQSAFKVWQTGNIFPPKIEPFYHNLLHKYFGFWKAEEILRTFRKIKRMLDFRKN